MTYARAEHAAVLRVKEAPARPPSRFQARVERFGTGDRIAAAALLLQILVTLGVAWRGGLYQDDIRAIVLISGLPFTDSLLWTNATHVVPGTHAFLWLHGRLFGLDYWPALVVISTLRIAASYATWRMLRVLFGSRPSIAVIFAFTALTPMALTATAWYAQALTILPVQLTTALAVTSLFHYRQTKGARHILGVSLAVALGLCFAEKTIALLALLPTLYCLVIARARSLRGAVAALAESAKIWASLGLVGLAWILTYTSSGGMDGHPVSGLELSRIAVDHAWLGFLPTLVGGPWTWRLRGRFYEDSPYFAIADPPLVASVLGTVLFALVAVMAYRFRRESAIRAALVLMSYYIPCFILVSLARGHMLADQLGVDLRFWADTVPVVGIAGGILVGGSGVLSDESKQRRLPRAVIAAAVTLWIIGMTVSAATFSSGWHRNDNAEFLARLQSDLDVLPHAVGVYETELPYRVISSQFGAEASTAFLIPWLAESVEVGRVRSEMVMVDGEGDLTAATWTPSATGTGARECGWDFSRAGSQPIAVQLTSATPAAQNLSVLIEVQSSTRTWMGVEVRYDGEWWQVVRQSGVNRQWKMPVSRGSSTNVYKLPSTLPVDAVRLSRPPGRGEMCVSRVEIGKPTQPERGT